jgi:hypothetical protein
MQHQEIVAHLAVDPTEIIYAVRMEDLLSVLINRHGDEVLNLTMDDLHTIREEVLIAFEEFDPRDYLNEGIDAWALIRNL